MPVTVEWLLAQPELQLRRVAGETAGVDVSWAHAMEVLDPAPWLAGGELVMTTGLRLPRARLEQAAYVDRLVAGGAAGLAFGVGIRFTDVPQGLVDRCEETGLPLLEVPLPTPFIAVAQTVGRRLADESEEALQRTVRSQQELTRITLRSGLVGLTTRLAQELGAHVVVLDELGTVVAGSAGSQQLGEQVGAVLRGHRSGRLTATGVLRGLRVVGDLPEVASLEVQELSGRTARRGWLALQHLGAPDPGTRVLVNHAVSVATLHLDRPREVEDARIRIGGSILSLLLDRAPADATVVGHLRHFGFGAGDEVRVLSVSRPGTPALETAVQSQLTSAGLPHVMTRGDGDVVVLVRSGDAAHAVERAATALGTVGSGATTIGVSGPLIQEHAASGVVPARRAAHAAHLEGRPVGWFDSLTLELLLSDPAVHTHVAAMARSTLQPLLADPSRSEQDLVATLRAYLEYNGAWEAASRALGVHRHTLRNRVARIEALTGLPLEVADNRVVLRLALATLDDAR